MKVFKNLLIIFVLLAIIIGFTYYDVTNISATRYITRVETLTSPEIPEDLSNKTILFFSDLEYGTFTDKERLDNIVSRINAQSCDVVIFGGDLIDENVSYSEDFEEPLVTALSSIDAPLGKFAILGDNDTRDEDTLTAIQSIFFQSDFEILNNRSIHISDHTNEAIHIVGLADNINVEVNVDEAFANVPVDGYSIVISHTPDNAVSVPVDKTDYFLAGHSHGGQVYYLFGHLYSPSNTESYFRGKQTVQDDFVIDITNGIGTTDKDMRFLADAEIVVYELEKEVEKEKEGSPAQENKQEEPTEEIQEDVETEEETTEQSENN